MYTSGYNRPNFIATGYSSGFVSYCRPEDRRCTAFWTVVTTANLVKAGKSSELLEMKGSLSSDFGGSGRSSSLLETETLDQLAWALGNHHAPYKVSVTQGYELAQLAVALLNHDVNHADDNTPVLCTVYERQVVTDMIVLVHGAADQSTLLDDLLQADGRKLAAKSLSRYTSSTRP